MKKLFLFLFLLPFLLIGCSSGTNYSQEFKEAREQSEQKLKDSLDCNKDEECTSVILNIIDETNAYSGDPTEKNKEILFKSFDEFGKIRIRMETSFADSTSSLSDDYKKSNREYIEKEINDEVERLKNYINNKELDNLKSLLVEMMEQQ